MLITTSKNPAAQTRTVARALSFVFPHSSFEGRGKRPLSSLITKARKRKMGKVCTLYDQDRKLGSLQVLFLSEKGFEWLSPRLRITSAILHIPLPKKKTPRACCINFTGIKAASISKLFCDENESECGKGCKAGSKISAGANKITIHFSGKKFLTLGAKYEN